MRHGENNIDVEVNVMGTELEEKVVSFLVDGKLSCAVAFKIAKELKVGIREVGKTADELGIRIVKCQLGCFP